MINFKTLYVTWENKIHQRANLSSYVDNIHVLGLTGDDKRYIYIYVPIHSMWRHHPQGKRVSLHLKFTRPKLYLQNM